MEIIAFFSKDTIKTKNYRLIKMKLLKYQSLTLKTITKNRGNFMLNLHNKIEPYHTSSAADLLKETMADFNITQADLAKRLGIS